MPSWHNRILAACALLALAGCVTTTDLKNLQKQMDAKAAATDDRLTQLERQLATLEATAKQAQKDVADLQQRAKATDERAEALSGKTASALKRIEAAELAESEAQGALADLRRRAKTLEDRSDALSAKMTTAVKRLDVTEAHAGEVDLSLTGLDGRLKKDEAAATAVAGRLKKAELQVVAIGDQLQALDTARKRAEIQFTTLQSELDKNSATVVEFQKLVLKSLQSMRDQYASRTRALDALILQSVRDLYESQGKALDEVVKKGQTEALPTPAALNPGTGPAEPKPGKKNEPAPIVPVEE
jgi:chromosome segregation ATPase